MATTMDQRKSNLGAPIKSDEERKYPITIYKSGADIKKIGGKIAARFFLSNAFDTNIQSTKNK